MKVSKKDTDIFEVDAIGRLIALPVKLGAVLDKHAGGDESREWPVSLILLMGLACRNSDRCGICLINTSGQPFR